MSKIGIVILNYKTYKDTEKLVNEITSTESQYDIFIQVVDNASPNESYEYLVAHLKQPNVSVFLNNENSGFAKGNNVGLRMLQTFAPDYALILNNDIHFELSVLDRLIETYTNIGNCGAIAPIQKLPSGENECFHSLLQPTFGMDILSYSQLFNRRKRWWEYNENTPHKNVQEAPIIPGCFVFIDYNLFAEIGFFDESTFLFCEERFLARKLYDIGKKNYILLDCHYIHDHSKTIRQEVSSLNQKRLLRDGQIEYTKKYRKYPLLKIFLIHTMWQYFSMTFNVKLFVKKRLKKC